jgi:hypothetical protein
MRGRRGDKGEVNVGGEVGGMWELGKWRKCGDSWAVPSRSSGRDLEATRTKNARGVNFGESIEWIEIILQIEIKSQQDLSF